MIKPDLRLLVSASLLHGPGCPAAHSETWPWLGGFHALWSRACGSKGRWAGGEDLADLGPGRGGCRGGGAARPDRSTQGEGPRGSPGAAASGKVSLSAAASLGSPGTRGAERGPALEELPVS